MTDFSFTLKATDGAARLGAITTPRGVIRTPAFMPVGTAATVKAMYPDQVRDLGSDIIRLRGAGVPLRTDRDPNHMHHKFAIFDREVLLTGSYNWTRGAAEYNSENFVTTADPRLVAAFRAEFDRLWELHG